MARELWYTGAQSDDVEGSSGNGQGVIQIAQLSGVPVEAITLLATSSTWDDAEQIAATAQIHGTRSILVVTSWYHGRRALCAIRHQLRGTGVQLYYQPAQTIGFGPDDWWLSEGGRQTVTTELYKIIFYWGNYGLVPWIC